MLKTFLRKYSTQRVLNVSEKFLNRNPRNLELLRFTRKIEGWELQSPSKYYYLKCRIIQDKNDSIGIVEHISGKIVVEASTREVLVSSKLYSNTDISAVENIGSILAHRCLKSGILAVFFDQQEYSSQSEKVTAFCNAMTQGGVSLSEPVLAQKPFQIGVDYDSISEQERLRITDTKLIENLKITADWNKKSKYLVKMRFRPKEKNASKQMSFEKVSKGMWWHPFYNELIHPHDLPHWDENAVCKAKPVTVDDYLPELGVRYKLEKRNK